MEADVTKVFGQPASLGDILAKLTAEEQTNGPALINVLLLTYHDYSSIKEIMDWLQKRYLASVAESTGSSADSEREAEVQMARRIRIVNFVRVWIQYHFHDFEELGCYDLLNSFIGLLQVTGMSKASENLRSILNRKSEEFRALRSDLSKSLDQSKDATAPVRKERTASVSPSGKAWNKLLRSGTRTKEDGEYDSPVLQWDEVEIAKQLCLIDFDLMRMIRSRELLSSVWTKPELRQKKAAGVVALIDHFNRVALWVSTEILSAPDKSRSKVARHFTKVIKELVRLNNYCSAVSINAALCDATVARLNLIDMGSSAQKTYEQHKLLLNPGNRELRGIFRKSPPPFIPYPGMYLNDLALIDEGNPSRIDNMINFKKYIFLANSIDEFLRCQGGAYAFEVNSDIRDYIKQCALLTTDALMELSYKILPMKQPDVSGAFAAASRGGTDTLSRTVSMSAPRSSSPPPAFSSSGSPVSTTLNPSYSGSVTVASLIASSSAQPRSPKEDAPPPPPPRTPEDMVASTAAEFSSLHQQLREREDVIAKLQNELDQERQRSKKLANALRAVLQTSQSALEP